MLRLLEKSADERDLAGQEQAGGGRKDVGDALRRRVRPMRGAEGVVDVLIEAGCELLREGGVVLLLLRVEPEVLQQEDLAGLEGVDLRANRVTDAVRGQLDRDAEKLGEPPGDGCQGEPGRTSPWDDRGDCTPPPRHRRRGAPGSSARTP